eukprot:CAMPEP_0206626532 /NCGR_PEP_ID=MMETSP0325_2-20121206/65344_1 /ASSEMBLY_ACC=CAM_ASM_000347 /TAXON_ID=2866 /ORGANISM="Crypthecodinium cohnii, Strain Seligo" /LENGTH=528 /DNA_ID=CAMNT_0054150839 /DNA_START=116 /DNA_END=1702 /DNA_ORIENTATION=+
MVPVAKRKSSDLPSCAGGRGRAGAGAGAGVGRAGRCRTSTVALSRNQLPLLSPKQPSLLLLASTLWLSTRFSVVSAAATPQEDLANLDPGELVTIPLDKQYVPVTRDGVTVAHKTAYFGKVMLGAPAQNFSVVFDTGSGHVFLPSSACTSSTCQSHRRYERSLSDTAQDINYDGEVIDIDDEHDEVSIVYGTGEILGQFVEETVCLPGYGGSEACSKVRVILASEMSEEPFRAFEFDGVIGLGLEPLALQSGFSFLSMLANSPSLTQARFGYFLSNVDTVPSEISFGGHDSRRVETPLSWEPVHSPDMGYWQVKIRSISVAGKELEVCADGGCTAIADTGTSLLGVPREAMRHMHVQLARKVPGDPERVDCRHFDGPQIVVELSSGLQLKLGPEDYSRAASMKVTQNSTGRSQVFCRASLMPVEAGTPLGPKAWIFGEPVLRKYYTVYDWALHKIGFGLAVQPNDEDTTSTASVDPAGSGSSSSSSSSSGSGIVEPSDQSQQSLMRRHASSSVLATPEAPPAPAIVHI